MHFFAFQMVYMFMGNILRINEFKIPYLNTIFAHSVRTTLIYLYPGWTLGTLPNWIRIFKDESVSPKH